MLNHIAGAVVDHFNHFQFHEAPQRYQDSVQDYAIHLLSLGCFYMEYGDAVCDGDGGRVLCCR